MIHRTLALLALALFTLVGQAQSLTFEQRQTLKAAIQAAPAANKMYVDGNLQGLADFYNAVASPAWKVWRTSVSRAEIYNQTSDEATNWSWTFYKNQSAVEQNSWVQMFMGDSADFSRPNLRAGIVIIFTGASAVNATHALAIGKRSATVAEKLFSTGAGTVPSPATMTREGPLVYTDFQGL